MTYKIGDRIKMTTKTYGEAVFDRKGQMIHMQPIEDVYKGVVTYVGPECPFPSAEVVRCTGGNVALKLNNGFNFYPKLNGVDQKVEVLK